MRRLCRIGWLPALLLALAPAATALLVDTADPQLYERPPADDPGWNNVGRRGTTSAIYLGDGWILTASHAAVGEVEFGGKPYQPVEDSMHWIEGPGGTRADLIVFRVSPEPALPPLLLAQRSPELGAPALLIGYGQGRGDVAHGGPGFQLDGRGEKRWGSNTVEASRLDLPGPNQTLTRCFVMKFSHGASLHEAQATVGDSGGAVFVGGPGRWRLAGVMLSVARLPHQEANEVLFGNFTHAADLSLYAPSIGALIGRENHAPRTHLAHDLP